MENIEQNNGGDNDNDNDNGSDDNMNSNHDYGSGGGKRSISDIIDGGSGGSDDNMNSNHDYGSGGSDGSQVETQTSLLSQQSRSMYELLGVSSIQLNGLILSAFNKLKNIVNNADKFLIKGVKKADKFVKESAEKRVKINQNEEAKIIEERIEKQNEIDTIESQLKRGFNRCTFVHQGALAAKAAKSNKFRHRRMVKILERYRSESNTPRIILKINSPFYLLIIYKGFYSFALNNPDTATFECVNTNQEYNILLTHQKEEAAAAGAAGAAAAAAENNSLLVFSTIFSKIYEIIKNLERDLKHDAISYYNTTVFIDDSSGKTKFIKEKTDTYNKEIIDYCKVLIINSFCRFFKLTDENVIVAVKELLLDKAENSRPEEIRPPEGININITASHQKNIEIFFNLLNIWYGTLIEDHVLMIQDPKKNMSQLTRSFSNTSVVLNRIKSLQTTDHPFLHTRFYVKNMNERGDLKIKRQIERDVDNIGLYGDINKIIEDIALKIATKYKLEREIDQLDRELKLLRIKIMWNESASTNFDIPETNHEELIRRTISIFYRSVKVNQEIISGLILSGIFGGFKETYVVLMSESYKQAIKGVLKRENISKNLHTRVETQLAGEATGEAAGGGGGGPSGGGGGGFGGGFGGGGGGGGGRGGAAQQQELEAQQQLEAAIEAEAEGGVGTVVSANDRAAEKEDATASGEPSPYDYIVRGFVKTLNITISSKINRQHKNAIVHFILLMFIINSSSLLLFIRSLDIAKIAIILTQKAKKNNDKEKQEKINSILKKIYKEIYDLKHAFEIALTEISIKLGRNIEIAISKFFNLILECICSCIKKIKDKPIIDDTIDILGDYTNSIKGIFERSQEMTVILTSLRNLSINTSEKIIGMILKYSKQITSACFKQSEQQSKKQINVSNYSNKMHTFSGGKALEKVVEDARRVVITAKAAARNAVAKAAAEEAKKERAAAEEAQVKAKTAAEEAEAARGEMETAAAEEALVKANTAAAEATAAAAKHTYAETVAKQPEAAVEIQAQAEDMNGESEEVRRAKSIDNFIKDIFLFLFLIERFKMCDLYISENADVENLYSLLFNLNIYIISMAKKKISKNNKNMNINGDTLSQTKKFTAFINEYFDITSSKKLPKIYDTYMRMFLPSSPNLFTDISIQPNYSNKIVFPTNLQVHHNDGLNRFNIYLYSLYSLYSEKLHAPASQELLALMTAGRGMEVGEEEGLALIQEVAGGAPGGGGGGGGRGAAEGGGLGGGGTRRNRKKSIKKLKKSIKKTKKKSIKKPKKSIKKPKKTKKNKRFILKKIN